MELIEKSTHRGFALIEFTDLFGSACSMQASSLATETAVWLGVSDPRPMVTVAEARRLGVETTETSGWVPYPIPREVMLTTRMHLTQEQVADLLPALQHFSETGEVSATTASVDRVRPLVQMPGSQRNGDASAERTMDEDALRIAAEEFVRGCEAGDIRIQEWYAAFKTALAQRPPVAGAAAKANG